MPPRPASEPPPQKKSDPPPRAGGSEPPGPIAATRTVVVSGRSASNAPPAAAAPKASRSKTVPGGLEGPDAAALAGTPASPAPQTAHSPPAAPLFGSRPPPGAGSYSVSSSHHPAMDPRSGGGRTSVERLSPLQSAHPPVAQPAPVSRRGTSPLPSANAQQIVSLPPALDPEAEIWAARFETPPPPAPDPEPNPAIAAGPAASAAATEGPPDETTRKRAGRWKTQVMGSMVPLEVMAAREAHPVDSEQPDSLFDRPERAPFVAQPGTQLVVAQHQLVAQPRTAHQAEPVRRQAPTPTASTIIQQDMPFGWQPKLDAPASEIGSLANAILNEAANQNITLLVTGSATLARAHFASALALAVSESGPRVLLIEADFDSPALHRALDFTAPAGAGFSQQLMARRQMRHPEPWVVARCSPNLHVLGEGRFRSPGLVATREFESAIQELREQYHVVIVHAPALTKVEDLRPLAFLSQGVVVVRTGQPTKAQFGPDALRLLS